MNDPRIKSGDDKDRIKSGDDNDRIKSGDDNDRIKSGDDRIKNPLLSERVVASKSASTLLVKIKKPSLFQKGSLQAKEVQSIFRV